MHNKIKLVFPMGNSNKFKTFLFSLYYRRESWLLRHPIGLPPAYKPFPVDLEHLMENIKEQYVNISIEEAIIVENVDNFIDERYTEIHFDLKDGVFEILMLGDGMDSKVFRETFPKIAATTKVIEKLRSGLGRYGWGMKVSMCVADYMIIETKKGNFRGAQSWKLIDGIPQYKKESPKKQSKKDFTLVTIKLNKSYRQKITSEFVEETLQRFYPTILSGAPVRNRYGKKRKLKVFLNSKLVEPPTMVGYEKKKPIKARVVGHQATGYVYLAEKSLSREERGISIIVHGRKIMKDFFGVHGSKDERITGHLHADMLIEDIAGDKTLIRRASYRWRKLSEGVAKQLENFMKEIGAIREEKMPKDIMKHVHEEINKLIRSFPELQELARKVGISMGGNVLIPKIGGDVLAKLEEGSTRTRGLKRGSSKGGLGVPTGPGEESAKAPSDEMGEKRAVRKKRRRGLQINVRPEPEMKKEAWFSPNGFVIINSRFPTYDKAKKMGSSKYHMCRCCIEALLNFAIENEIIKEEEATDYRNEVLAKWGGL